MVIFRTLAYMFALMRERRERRKLKKWVVMAVILSVISLFILLRRRKPKAIKE